MTERLHSNEGHKEGIYHIMNDMVKNSKAKCALSLVLIGVILVAVIVACKHSNLLISTDHSTALLDPIVIQPDFSHESGFYEEAFYLELQAPANTKIYYTLDCSDPDENSIEYKQPIRIENVSGNANKYSMITDVSVGFYSDLIEKYQPDISAPGYKAPDYPVKKCMVVRAIAVDENGNYSDIQTNSYFVDEDLAFFNGCNIISVVTDPQNLFDSGKGIYVAGDVFDDYIFKKQMADYWELWDANYRQKGSKWERPIDFTCFDKNGELLLSLSGGIRTQGGISRGSLPRSLNLYLNPKDTDESVTAAQLFGSDFAPTKLTLFAGGNEKITVINDYMVVDRTRHLNFTTMDYKPYVLFLEGEYWGFYWLTDAYNERYLAYHYGVEEDDVIIVKNGALEAGSDIDILFYDNMTKFITQNDMSLSENYQQACQLIDIDSFLDYYACLAYIARNGDWPSSNFALWRTKSTGTGYSDGKWRWMLFDCNSSAMTESLITHNTLDYIINEDKLFRSFWNNGEFRLAFKERILKIADECFDAQEISDYLDQYTEKMLPTLTHVWARFYGSDNTKEYSYQYLIEQYRAFFNARRNVVASWFE